MGVASALIYPTTLAIITDTFRDPKQRAAAIGVWGAVTGLGVAIGPILGGALLEIVLVGQPVSGAGADRPDRRARRCAVRARVDHAATAARLDRGGLLLSVVMLGALVYTIIEAPDHGWAAPRTLTRVRRRTGSGDGLRAGGSGGTATR